ncbi:hypothetical protein KC722_00475 [Candidatus Kaiserbacteria bacterium]|nr:hypothetical protein [Candidatus Kaiserbacteria bacterium]
MLTTFLRQGLVTLFMLSLSVSVLSLPRTSAAATQSFDDFMAAANEAANLAQGLADSAGGGGGGLDVNKILSTANSVASLVEQLKKFISGSGASCPCPNGPRVVKGSKEYKRIAAQYCVACADLLTEFGTGSGGDTVGDTLSQLGLGRELNLSELTQMLQGAQQLMSTIQQFAGGGSGGSGGGSGSGGSLSNSGNGLEGYNSSSYEQTIQQILSTATSEGSGNSAATQAVQEKLGAIAPLLARYNSTSITGAQAQVGGTGSQSSPSLASTLKNTFGLSGITNAFNWFTGSRDQQSAASPAAAQSDFSADDIDYTTSIYVNPDSRIADEEYYQYTIHLTTGEIRTVILPAFAPASSHISRLATIGFRGSLIDFLATVRSEDNSYELADVERVTVAEIDPLANSQADDYKEYTIYLKNGFTFVVHTQDGVTASQFNQFVRDTGFEGDISELIDMAVETDAIGDVSFFARIKQLVFNGVESVLSLFTGSSDNGYTELPISDTNTDYGNTDTFYADPNSGSEPLTVAFTIAHPGTTINFGDGSESIETSCELSSNSTASYTSENVAYIVYSEVETPAGWQRTYKIKLRDRSIRTVHYASDEDISLLYARFEATGYEGDGNDLYKLAEEAHGHSFAKETTYLNPNGHCLNPTTVEHTYTVIGSYTATLSSNDCETDCTTVASLRIYVGDDTDTSPRDNFSASPFRGSAPLRVTFTTTYGDYSEYRPSATDAQDTLIDFGDGSDPLWVQCSDAYCVFKSDPDSTGSTQHTYQSDGVYTAKIYKGGGMCVGECPTTLLGSLIIAVGDTTDPNFSATPDSGSAPLAVTFKSRYGDQFTGSNTTQTYIDFGDGSSKVHMQCSTQDQPQVCPQDAKLCADGSYVSRTGPNCTFPACPVSALNSDSSTGDNCISAGKLYPAGAKIQQITTSGGLSQSVDDGSFVCSNGNWMIQGSDWSTDDSLSPLCSSATTVVHSYSVAGTYVAKILRAYPACSGTQCDEDVIAINTISVSDTSSNTNEISFEAKVTGQGSSAVTDLPVLNSGQSLTPLNAWTTGPIVMLAGHTLQLRWDATNYQKCITFFADGGLYALSRRSDPLVSGNTETEGFNVSKRSGEYRIECEGQGNGETAVDSRSIRVTIIGGGYPQNNVPGFNSAGALDTSGENRSSVTGQ